MKPAIQSDYYIKQYGLEEGLRHIKSLGYEAISCPEVKPATAWAIFL